VTVGTSAGIFSTYGRKSAGSDGLDFDLSQEIRVLRLARSLLFRISGNPMFRAAVFSVVLLLAIGQDATLVCKVWCHSDGRAMAECRAQAGNSTTPSLTGNDGCDRAEGGATILAREEGRRGSDYQHAHHAAVVPLHHGAGYSGDSCLHFDYARTATAESLPLVLALRI
jgi:hypothetical protein